MVKKPMFYSIILLLLLSISPIMLHAQLRVGTKLKDYSTDIMSVKLDNYPEVRLTVGVTDGSGNPVFDLKRQDFSLQEDGAQRRISRARLLTKRTHSSVVLAVDVSGSMKGTPMEDTKAALLEFLDVLSPSTDVALVTFSNNPAIVSGFTNDSRVLRAAIESLEPDAKTALYDAIGLGVELLKDQDGQRFILALTDGIDNASSDKDMKFIGRALREKVSVYTIAFGEPYSMQINSSFQVVWAMSRDDDVLKKIATRTHGDFLLSESSSELSQVFSKFGKKLNSLYTLVFTSPPLAPDVYEHQLVLGMNDAHFPENKYTKQEFALTDSLLNRASLGVSPRSIDFDSVAINLTGNKTLLVSNRNYVTSFALEMFPSEGFSLNVDSLAFNEGDQSSITVTFTPELDQPYDGKIIFVERDSHLKLAEVALRGIGYIEPPLIAVSDSALEFGPVVLNTERRQTLTVSNTEDNSTLEVTLELQDSTFSASPDSFTITGANSREVVIAFAPTLEGVHSAALLLNSNSKSQSDMRVELIATGTSPTWLRYWPIAIVAGSLLILLAYGRRKKRISGADSEVTG